MSKLPSIEKIINNFKALEEAYGNDWTEKYRYIIKLGTLLPTMPEEEKIEENLVNGCISKVWLTFDAKNDIIEFRADSDAAITKGLVAILISIYNNKTIDEMAAIELEPIFKVLNLENNLTPNRRNGFYSMVKRIGELAGIS